MKPIELKIQPTGFSVFSSRKQDPAFAKFAEKVFKRDDHTCQFCGFQAEYFQEIVNQDHNYYNNKLSNMVTACCFCTQCFFLEAVGTSYGGGTLVYIPEISQAELNSFCHVLFCAITNDTGYRATAQNIYRSLKFRAQPVEDQFGEGTSDPAIFSQLVIDIQKDDDVDLKTLLTNVCLLPSRARFKKQIETWAATALAELTTEFRD